MLILNQESKLPAIFSLCDYSGNWSKYFAENNYPVILFDLKHGDDIVDGQHEVLTCGKFFNYNILGVLASPPCTDFTVSGAQYWKVKDADGRTEESLKLIDSCLEIIEILKPKFFALENPVGRLPKLRPELGKPSYYFNPCDYAGYSHNPEKDRYTKKTGIWGNSIQPEKKYLEPVKVCPQGSWIQKLGGKSERTKELRSMTPLGYAKAFYLANKI